MKTTILIILSLISTSVFAGAFDQFLHGLQKDYFFHRKDRGIELSNSVRVAKFGPFGRVMNPDAIATYNGNLNVINLDETLLEDEGRSKRIKDARLIRGGNFQQSYHLATIFHEMGHAELDVYIEKRREPEDQALMTHYDSVLKDFYKGNFRSFNAHTVFHEHFGYYRTDLIEFFTNEVGNVLLNNGFNKFKKTCFMNNFLRAKLAEGVSLPDFQKLHVIGEDVPYRTKVGPRYVYVKGKDIDLLSAPNGKAVLDQTHNLMWAYHQKMYNFPVNHTDLVARMNVDHEFKAALVECRTKIWNEAWPNP